MGLLVTSWFRELRHWTVIIGLVLGLITSTDSFGCSCAAYPDDEAKAARLAYTQADAVFLGSVTRIKSRPIHWPPVRDSFFDVEKFWKGHRWIEDTVVRSAMSETACGFKFRKGTRYLVFAYWDEKRGILWTNMCELNREESEAQGLIRELDSLESTEQSK